MTAHVPLTDEQTEALEVLSYQTGKTSEELVIEAINQFLEDNRIEKRNALLSQGRGIWKDRTDLPDLRELREEWNRSE